MATSVVYAFEYLMGFPIFGILYWILNGVLLDFKILSVENSTYHFCNIMWDGAVVIYIIFGIFYLIRRIKTWMILK